MNERWNFLTVKFRSICFRKENGTIKSLLTDKIIEKKEKEKKSFMEDVNGRIKDNIYDEIIPYGKEILTTSPEPDATLDYKDDNGNGKS